MDQTRLAIYTLGTPRVECGGAAVELRRRTLAVLVYLAVENRRLHREFLTTTFWPEQDRSQGSANLRHVLWEINKTLGEGWLEADRETVARAPDRDVWLDVNEFRQQLDAAKGYGQAGAIIHPAHLDALRRAVDLYRGTFLEGFGALGSVAFDDWQQFTAGGVRDQVTGALNQLISVEAKQRNLAAAVKYARRWLALDPLEEEAHRKLMLLHALGGRRSAALQQYEECVRLLQAEMGVPPDARTKALAERIRSGALSAPGIDGDTAGWTGAPTPALARASKPQHTLPIEPTPFVGREAELAELGQMLVDPTVRLVSIVGLGGMGKTRLAVELANQQQDCFSHGVAFVPLVSVTSGASVAAALVSALDLPSRSGVTQHHQALDYLREKRMLLVLDNFEHLLDEAGGSDAAELVNEILLTAAGVKMLVTSRVPLNLLGEQRYLLAGLDTASGEPGEALTGSSAVKLFVQGAQRLRFGFRLNDRNTTHVLQICRLVGGMPLGILLAAGLMGVLSAAEVAAEIERGRDFLQADWRDLPERQRSLRAVFEQTWSLLDPAERKVLPQLSVLRGPFGRQAAQEVAGAGVYELHSLIGKALLHRVGEDRFELHPQVQRFAAEKLVEDPAWAEAVHDRHSLYFCGVAAELGEALRGPRQKQARFQFENDEVNIAAAWEWATEHLRTDWLRLTTPGLGLYFWRGGRPEPGEAAFRAAADALQRDWATGTEVDGVALAHVLAWQALFISNLGQHSLARRLMEQVMEQLPDSSSDVSASRLARAFGLWVLADVEQPVGERRELLEQSLDLFQREGEAWWCSQVLFRLGRLDWLDAIGRDSQHFGQCLAIRRQLGDQLGVAEAVVQLAFFSFYVEGQIEQAIRLWRECCAIFSELSDRDSIGESLTSLGNIASEEGRWADAVDLRQQSLAVAQDLGDRIAMLNRIASLCEAYTMVGDYRQAREVGERAMREWDLHDVPEHALWLRRFLGFTLLALDQSAAAFQLFDEALRLSRELAAKAAYSGAYLGLSRAAWAQGKHAEARAYNLAALRNQLEYPNFFWLCYVIANATLLYLDEGKVARAVELWSLMSHYPFVANSVWFADVYGRYVETAAAGLPPEKLVAVRERGRALDPWATARALVREYEAIAP